MIAEDEPLTREETTSDNVLWMWTRWPIQICWTKPHGEKVIAIWSVPLNRGRLFEVVLGRLCVSLKCGR